ncbi:MAG: hypothetical protein ACC657_12240 [Thiohalomonadales bacterium]
MIILNKLKYLLSVIMVIGLISALGACSSGGSDTPVIDKTLTTNDSANFSTAEAAASATLDSIQVSETIFGSTQWITGNSGMGGFGFSGLPRCNISNPGTIAATHEVGSHTIVITDYCIELRNQDQIKINGTLAINMTDTIPPTRTIVTSNFTVATKNETYTINIDILIGPDGIQYNQFSYTDSKGVEHEIPGRGNFKPGKGGNHKFPWAGKGNYEVLTPLEYNCSNKKYRPSAGKIKITGKDKSTAIITFIDCSNYSIEIAGVVKEYQWPTKPGWNNPGNNPGGKKPVTGKSINANNVNNILMDALGSVQGNVGQSFAYEMLMPSIFGPVPGNGNGGGKFINPVNCGGTKVVTKDTTNTNIVFNGYCVEIKNQGQAVVNGSMAINFNADTNVRTIKSTDLSINIKSGTYLINVDIVIDPSANPVFQVNQLNYIDPDGVTHDITRFKSNGMGGGFGIPASGSGSLGYNDIGAVTVTIVTPLEFTCGNFKPGVGEILIESKDGSSATIVFNDCSTYTITRDGVSTDYTWPNKAIK